MNNGVDEHGLGPRLGRATGGQNGQREKAFDIASTHATRNRQTVDDDGAQLPSNNMAPAMQTREAQMALFQGGAPPAQASHQVNQSLQHSQAHPPSQDGAIPMSRSVFYLPQGTNLQAQENTIVANETHQSMTTYAPPTHSPHNQLPQAAQEHYSRTPSSQQYYSGTPSSSQQQYTETEATTHQLQHAHQQTQASLYGAYSNQTQGSLYGAYSNQTQASLYGAYSNQPQSQYYNHTSTPQTSTSMYQSQPGQYNMTAELAGYASQPPVPPQFASPAAVQGPTLQQQLHRIFRLTTRILVLSIQREVVAEEQEVMVAREVMVAEEQEVMVAREVMVAEREKEVATSLKVQIGADNPSDPHGGVVLTISNSGSVNHPAHGAQGVQNAAFAGTRMTSSSVPAAGAQTAHGNNTVYSPSNSQVNSSDLSSNSGFSNGTRSDVLGTYYETNRRPKPPNPDLLTPEGSDRGSSHDSGSDVGSSQSGSKKKRKTRNSGPLAAPTPRLARYHALNIQDIISDGKGVFKGIILGSQPYGNHIQSNEAATNSFLAAATAKGLDYECKPAHTAAVKISDSAVRGAVKTAARVGLVGRYKILPDLSQPNKDAQGQDIPWTKADIEIYVINRVQHLLAEGKFRYMHQDHHETPNDPVPPEKKFNNPHLEHVIQNHIYGYEDNSYIPAPNSVASQFPGVFMAAVPLETVALFGIMTRHCIKEFETGSTRANNSLNAPTDGVEYNKLLKALREFVATDYGPTYRAMLASWTSKTPSAPAPAIGVHAAFAPALGVQVAPAPATAGGWANASIPAPAIGVQAASAPAPGFQVAPASAPAGGWANASVPALAIGVQGASAPAPGVQVAPAPALAGGWAYAPVPAPAIGVQGASAPAPGVQVAPAPWQGDGPSASG
ncbi:hypothetical protein R3P38DRAFT_2756387 [Favolaschia claudopus]|uniref:DUF6532 domain-containing protein n=1 Tax=Favolaschia claudopus TaxID=2862362 RepID=A0AAW0EEG5_9AGAR